MTKRRVIIALLAVAAVGLAVVAVPRAILEWHVHKVATDREVLLEALQAPEDSWWGRAVEAYTGTPEGAETLRREFATLMLSQPVISVSSGSQRSAPPSPLQETLPQALNYFAMPQGSWLFRLERFRSVSVLRRSHRTKRGGLNTRTGPAWRESSTTLIAGGGQVDWIKRFVRLVKPSDKPVFETLDFTAYVVQVSDPAVPPAALRDPIDPNELVLYLRPKRTHDNPDEDSSEPD